MNIIVKIPVLLSLASATTTSAPEEIGRDWLRHNAESLWALAGGWFGDMGGSQWQGELESGNPTERQFNLVANALIDCRLKINTFPNSLSLFSALDRELAPLGVDLTMTHLLTDLGLPIMRLTQRLPELERNEYALFLMMFARARARADEISLSSGLAVENYFLPLIALEQLFKPGGRAFHSASYRKAVLERMEESEALVDSREVENAISRARAVLNAESGWMLSGVYNEFLPKLASLKWTSDLRAYTKREFGVVEGWLSTGFVRNHLECAELIAEAIEQITFQCRNNSRDYEISSNPLVAKRAVIFKDMEDKWNARCAAESAQPAPAPVIAPLGGLMYKIDFLFQQLIGTKQVSSFAGGARHIHTLTSALGLEGEYLAPEIVQTLKAAREAIYPERFRIKMVQIDHLHASLIKLVERLERDMFAGLIEATYDLGRYGINLLQFSTIPGQSAERILEIDKIVSYWLICRTTSETRSVMIEYMKTASDVELRRMSQAWLSYSKAYSQFKKMAEFEHAVAGFLPDFVVLEPLKMSQVEPLVDWMIRIEEMEDLMSQMTGVSVMSGQLFCNQLLLLPDIQSPEQLPWRQTLVRMTFTLAGLVFKSLLAKPAIHESVLDTVGLLLQTALESEQTLPEQGVGSIVHEFIMLDSNSVRFADMTDEAVIGMLADICDRLRNLI